MNAYFPRNWSVIGVVAAALAAELVIGYMLNRATSARRWLRLTAWAMTLVLTVAVERLTQYEPAGVRMIAIVGTLLYGMKAVVGVEAQAGLSPLRWLGFCVLWFGMRPSVFTRAGRPALPEASVLVARGIGRIILGLVLVLMAWLMWESRLTLGDTASRWLATPPLLIGLSLMLHFGVFNVLAGIWRRLGVDCRALFRAPVLSTSLNEFWSRRWNLAFSEMTALAIFRPVSESLGRRAALVIAFLVSGLLHEVAISVPVLAGFGGPSLYFTLHGVLVIIENWLERRGTPIHSHPLMGRIWTLAWLALPLPILFHRPFLAGIVWPIVGITAD